MLPSWRSQLALPFYWLVAASVLQDRLPVGASALRVAYPDGCSVIYDL